MWGFKTFFFWLIAYTLVCCQPILSGTEESTEQSQATEDMTNFFKEAGLKRGELSCEQMDKILAKIKELECKE